VTGAEAAKKLRAMVALVGDRQSVTVDELVAMLTGDARTQLSAKRAAAGRAGGQRSAIARLEATGSNRPKQPEANPRSKPEANSEAKPKQATPPSSPPLHSPSSPAPEKPKDNNNFQGLVRSPAGAVVVVVGEKTGLQKPESKTPPIARLPRSLSEALELPLMERAQMLWKVRDAAFDAEAFNAHAWPELQELARAFREASGLAHVQAGPWPNAATKRLVELLAVPHLPSTIREAFCALKTSSWWSTPERRRLGLAGISPRVLEGLLTEAAGGGTKRLSPEELDRLFATEATHATA
jgi:hypothetical protein